MRAERGILVHTSATAGRLDYRHVQNQKPQSSEIRNLKINGLLGFRDGSGYSVVLGTRVVGTIPSVTDCLQKYVDFDFDMIKH